MIADGGVLYISEVGPVCDKICVRTDTPIVAIPGSRFRTQIIDEQFLENSCTKAVLELGVAWNGNGVRLCLAGETSDQVGGRVENPEFSGYPPS